MPTLQSTPRQAAEALVAIMVAGMRARSGRVALRRRTERGAMAELDALRSDLAAEQRALDDIVSALSDEQWGLATSSPGWDVTDQVAISRTSTAPRRWPSRPRGFLGRCGRPLRRRDHGRT